MEETKMDKMSKASPIYFRKHLQLTEIGINANAISSTTITMESSKNICVRENGTQVAIIHLSGNPSVVKPNALFVIDSANLCPTGKYLLLKNARTLGFFKTENSECMKEHTMTEEVKFCKWISFKSLGIVTENSVYHWMVEDSSTPQKMFDRNLQLDFGAITTYCTDLKQQWLLLISITQMQAGIMQLYSVECKESKVYDGHAAAFAKFKMELNPEPTNLLCYAEQSIDGGKLHVIEVGSPATGNQPFTEKKVDIPILRGDQSDFPIAIHVSTKYGLIYSITKCGYIQINYIESGTCIFAKEMSVDSILVTVEDFIVTQHDRIVCVDSNGLVVWIGIDEEGIIPFIKDVLKNIDLALRIIVRSNLTDGEDLFVERFNTLFHNAQYVEAAKLAALAPKGFLRTPETIRKFKQVQSPAFPAPVLLYLNNILNMGDHLDEQHTIELFETIYSYESDLISKNKIKYSKPLVNSMIQRTSDLINQFCSRDGVAFTNLDKFRAAVDNILKEEVQEHSPTGSLKRANEDNSTALKKHKSGDESNQNDPDTTVSSTTSDDSDLPKSIIQNIREVLPAVPEHDLDTIEYILKKHSKTN